jgi:hypothetical protein
MIEARGSLSTTVFAGDAAIPLVLGAVQFSRRDA